MTALSASAGAASAAAAVCSRCAGPVNLHNAHDAPSGKVCQLCALTMAETDMDIDRVAAEGSGNAALGFFVGFSASGLGLMWALTADGRPHTKNGALFGFFASAFLAFVMALT